MTSVFSAEHVPVRANWDCEVCVLSQQHQRWVVFLVGIFTGFGIAGFMGV